MAKSILRAAVEEVNEANAAPIKVSGPLSEIYTQALNQIYSKDVARQAETPSGAPITDFASAEKPNKLSVEGQAFFNAVIQGIADKSSGGSNPGDIQQDAIIYGVDQHDVTENDVINVTRELNENPDQTFILVTDATGTNYDGDTVSDRFQNISPIASSLEALVKSYPKNKYVFHSLKDALNVLK